MINLVVVPLGRAASGNILQTPSFVSVSFRSPLGREVWPLAVPLRLTLIQAASYNPFTRGDVSISLSAESSEPWSKT